MSHWALIRGGIIAFAGVSSALTPLEESASSEIGWGPVVAGLLFFPIIVGVGGGVCLCVFRSKLAFENPSWERNPFDFSHPEQFFHMAGYAMLATGLGLVFSETITFMDISAAALAPGAMGIGILVGLWILSKFPRAKQ